MLFRKAEPYLWLNPQTGYYCAVFNDDQNKPRRKSLKTQDKKEAQRRFNAWRRDFLIAWGSPADPKESNITIADFIEEWVGHISARHPNSTTVQYRSTANKFIKVYGRLKVRELSVRIVTLFIDDLIRDGLAFPTVNKHRRHLRILLNYAEEQGYILRRPPLPKPVHEKNSLKYFTEEQLHALFSVIDDPEFKDFCLLGLLSALRSGELIRLTAADIDHPPGFIRVSEHQKNRTEARIPITQGIRPIVEKYSTMRPNGRLFPYTSPSAISRKFKKYLELSGIEGKRSFHSLRHSYGTSMVTNGANLTAIKDLMRHKSIASTMVYAKVIPAHLIQTGELMQFSPVEPSPENRREIVEETGHKGEEISGKVIDKPEVKIRKRQ